MKHRIDKIINELKEKEERLNTKVNNLFSGIYIPSTSSANTESRGAGKTPPIAYLLYGITGITAISGFVAADTISKIVCFGVAGACGFGGYRMSFGKKQDVREPKSSVNPMELKNEVIGKISDCIKGMDKDWESFMEIKQKEIQSFIQNSDMSAEEKDFRLSRIYTYEVIDISILEFASKVNSLQNNSSIAEEMKALLKQYQPKVDAAISNAVSKQIKKYQSLV